MSASDGSRASRGVSRLVPIAPLLFVLGCDPSGTGVPATPPKTADSPAEKSPPVKSPKKEQPGSAGYSGKGGNGGGGR